jgi:hypothetical protein
VQNVDATRRAVSPIELHQEVIIYGYVDFPAPLLAMMSGRRRAGYKAIGYEIITSENPSPSIQLKMENV